VRQGHGLPAGVRPPPAGTLLCVASLPALPQHLKKMKNRAVSFISRFVGRVHQHFHSFLLCQGSALPPCSLLFLSTEVCRFSTSFNLKNPVLVHYTRCMKLGLGKECSQGKKKKCNSLALVSSVLGENNVRTQARAVSQAQTLSIGYSSTFHTWSRSCVSNPLATLSLSVKRL